MGRIGTSRNIAGGALRILLVTCLVVGLAPAIAVADTSVGVQVEIPVQVNETVAIEGGAATGGSSAGGASESDAAGNGGTTDLAASNDNGATSDSATNPTAPDPTRIAADVPLTHSDTSSETLLFDGLTYELVSEANTATLIGWYSQAPKGNLSIPSQVSDGSNTYYVTSIGRKTAGSDNSTPNASQNSMGGGNFLPVLILAR